MSDLKKMEFYIVVPQAATNYVKNPSPFIDTTYYAAAGAGVTIERSDTEQRRGAYSIKVNTAASVTSHVYYATVPVVDGLTYTFSADVKTTAGEPMKLLVVDSTGASTIASTTFTSTGNWQRVSLTYTETATTTRRLYVQRVGTSANSYAFYTDGWQFEEGDEATTWFCGWSPGFNPRGRDLEFYWDGAGGNSYSYRTDRTRAGGRLLRIKDYASIKGVFGLGAGTFEQISTPVTTGGSLYQTHITKSRNFHFILDYNGDDQGDLQANRNTIINAVRPDYLEDQQLIIRYVGTDASGNEATNPIDIICTCVSGHEDTPDSPVHQRAPLVFEIQEGKMRGAFMEGSGLDLYETFTDADYIMKRSRLGQWSEMTNSGTGLNGAVRAIAEDSYGNIYVGGAFTNAGGVAAADYIAMWSKDNQAWEALGTGANDTVFAILVDQNDNVYIGGDFTAVGGVASTGQIAMWDGSSWNAVGSGFDSGSIYALVFDAAGVLYAGGTFDSAGIYLAKWDGSSWTNLSTSGNIITSLAFHPDGTLYIGGWTGVCAQSGQHLATYDGSSFSTPGGGITDDIVNALAVDSSGTVYIGGDFTEVGGATSKRYMVRWKDNWFRSMSGGQPNAAVHSISVAGSDVYIGGLFTSILNKNYADRIARYRNGAWSPIDIDLPGTPTTHAVFLTRSRDLYVGYTTAGTAYTGKIAVNALPTESTSNVYPIIQIHGPGPLNSIINYRNGRQIAFDGLTLLTGEFIQMELSPDNLKIFGNRPERQNLLRYVVPGSDQANFFLEPGTNYVSFFMPGLTGSPQAWIAWQPVYWSIDGAQF